MKFVKHSMIQNADMRLESGTCNVCSAPCSSCMHLNHALMGSKAEEFSDENCRLEEASNLCSMDESNLSSLRSRACESLQHAVSETSNVLSVNSGHDSLSENAESRQQTLSNKYNDSKCLEGHDDTTSCISRASDANLESTSHQRNEERIIISCTSASVSCLGAEGSGSTPSVHMSGLSEIPSSKDADTDHSSPKVHSLNEQSQRGKSLSDSPTLTHTEGDSCSHIPEKLSECPIENSNSSLTKETATLVVSVEKSIASKDSLIDGTAKVSLKVYPKPEADTDNIGDAKDDGHKCSVLDGQHEKAGELVKSPVKQELQSEDESDESDVVEHDVKVCDICGDAGREDLLAVCSRCSDGAEHTYCMREMLQKVPEGDWLCEECKDAEETENQRLDVEGKKTLKASSSTSQVSCKRPSENIEAAPAAKRPALESSTGSPKAPKATSPRRLVPLSRESSFKSLNKEKVKPGHLMPIRNHSGGDGTEIARSPSIGPRSQIPKSTLLKCNSFNNSKPRVKLVEEVPQKPKGSGEHNSKNMDMPSRMTGISTLFKSSSLGRTGATEPKVKMLSPKPATAQELKGSRQLKESGAFDRKFPSRIGRPVVSSSIASSVVSTAKGDQKHTSRGETATPSAVNNNREWKFNQDGKLSTLSKSVSNVSRKTTEPQVSSERTSTSVDEALQDVLPRSRETANQIEKTRGSSDCARPVVTTSSKTPFCQKCKEYGHAPEFCKAGSNQESRAEVSITTSSSSKEDMDNGSKLKAAIQAALLRRPEIYKKKEVPNQTDELSTSGMDLNCEVISQDQLMVSSTSKNNVSAEETHEKLEILENSTSDSSKCLSVNDLKQRYSCPTDFRSQPGKSDSIGLASGKPVAVVRDSSIKSLAIPSVRSKMLVVPEYEYIWQGVFEVHRNGKPPDFCAGVQAHLSSCASPKVLEVVNKFLPNVPLKEVSRLSSWPSQFHQVGAREDHIALYFFAKDIESYERHYKGLLDHMIRNDLALTGNLDGVELLIFPSNQLPEKSQRWNMLFFLWGVFRGRRINHHSDSGKKICIPSLNAMPVEEDSPAASEMHCSSKHMHEESSACDKVCSTLFPSTSVDLGKITARRNIDINDQTHLGSEVNLEKQDSGVDIKSTPRVPTGSALLCQEMESNGSSLKANVLEQGQCRESKPPEAMETSVSLEAKTNFDNSVKQEKALSSGVPSFGNRELCSASNISKDKMSEGVNSDEDQQSTRAKRKTGDHYIDLEATICDQGRDTESNPITDKISGKMNDDEDQQRPKRKLKEVDHYIDLEATIGNEETGAASNTSKDKVSETVNGAKDQPRLQRKQNDAHYIDLEAPVHNHETGDASSICKDNFLGKDGTDKQLPKMKHKDDHYVNLEATFQGDPTVVGANCQLPDDKKVQDVDVSDTFMQASAVSHRKRSRNVKLDDGGSSSKKLKAGFGGVYGCYSSGGRDSFSDNFATNNRSSYSSFENKACEVACDEKIIPEDVGTMERTFFPVDTQNISCSQLLLNSMPSKGAHGYEDRFQDVIPNLELALGGDIKLPPPPKDMLPFFVGAVDRKNGQEIRPDGLADGQEDSAAAASLSLSLSFPSSNKEHTTKAASKAEVLPDGGRVNTPFLLFGRYTDK